MTTITFYHKEGCHLCDKTRQHLRQLEQEMALTVEEVDITHDPDLFARYRYLIPVIDTRQGKLFTAPIDVGAVREVLRGQRS
jgi:thiol-disulfide isomerase/thioredoxin